MSEQNLNPAPFARSAGEAAIQKKTICSKKKKSEEVTF
jgi:hypothetical protein